MHGPIIIKTEEEIAIMREGGKMLHAIMDEVCRLVKPGISTGELDDFAMQLAAKNEVAPSFLNYGARKNRPGFPAMLCTSLNDEVVHGIPDPKRIIQEGDLVKIDCGIYHRGFHTDHCRTIIAGEKIDPFKLHFINTTKEALKRAIKAARAGGFVGDISEAIQKTVEQQGYSVVRSCTGHGVGRNLHEPPEIMNFGRKGTGPRLAAGMVLAIEPITAMGDGETADGSDGWTIFTTDHSLSAHFEHTVLITNNGAEILT